MPATTRAWLISWLVCLAVTSPAVAEKIPWQDPEYKTDIRATKADSRPGPGTFRAHLLETKAVTERIIMIDELLRSPRVFLVNSVRGRVPVAVTAG